MTNNTPIMRGTESLYNLVINNYLGMYVPSSSYHLRITLIKAIKTFLQKSVKPLINLTSFRCLRGNPQFLICRFEPILV